MERMRRIARFLGISIKDIQYMTPAGGDPNLVGHFVAVDRRSKAVVLAIRGTYSVSDVVTDLDAETGMFCTRVWEQDTRMIFVSFTHEQRLLPPLSP